MQEEFGVIHQRRAPVFSDGPVPIPGDKDRPVITMIRTLDNRLLPVMEVHPGAQVVFSEADASAPLQGYIGRRRTPLEPGSVSNAKALTLTKVPLRGVSSRHASSVGFVVPPLEAGTYDVWYTGGKPSVRKVEPSTRVRAPESASQHIVINVQPEIRPIRSVVTGTVGSTVDVEVSLAGGNAKLEPPVEVRLAGFNDVAASVGANRMMTDNSGVAHFKVQLTQEGDTYLGALAAGFTSVAIRIVSGPSVAKRDARVMPGDLLLCQGNRVISRAIQLGERLELGGKNPHGRPWYSHVAVSLGNGQTAEMLDHGLVKHLLDDTAAQCTTLDVYRRTDISPDTQHRVVDAIQRYGEVPYAWSQIGVVASAGILGQTLRFKESLLSFGLCILTEGLTCEMEASTAEAAAKALDASVVYYSLASVGKKQMICSEMAAWGYRDVGAALDVSPGWPDMPMKQLRQISEDAPVDFTTPNMIARSKDVNFVFQYWPPVKAAVVTNEQIELSEQIVFDTGSSSVSPSMSGLIAEIMETIVGHPEIKTITIEGHTDDTGSVERNLLLSQRRAEAVMKWLTDRGVDKGRLFATGYGSSKPIVANNNEQNRHRNRRVDFRLGTVESQR